MYVIIYVYTYVLPIIDTKKKLKFWSICHTWLMWVPCHTSRWAKLPFRVLPSYVFENHGGLRSLSPAE